MALVDAHKQIATIRKEQSSLLLSLVQSPADTLEKYREAVGRWQGLEYAIALLKEGMHDQDDDVESGVARAPQRARPHDALT